jgi:uncharacterized protein YndB with AHSA1/START domain
MTERSVSHAVFTIERAYDASPARVFAAWSDPKKKQRWFRGSGAWQRLEYALDFRVGGVEVQNSAAPGKSVHAYRAMIWDIVPDARIVFAYDMHIDETRISVSLTTVEIKAAGDGAKLIYTEQGAFLDGYDDAGSREQGSLQLLEQLGEFLIADT